MSLKVMTAVWDSSKHSGGKLLLMLAIADNANELGYSWPAYYTLAKKTRLEKRQVIRLVHELDQEGDELAVIWGGRGPRSTNRYYILVGKKDDEVQTIRHHVSEQNAKSHSQTLPLPLPESRAEEPSQPLVGSHENKGDKMSPLQKGDNPAVRVTFSAEKGDIFDDKGTVPIAKSALEPINHINHQHQNGEYARVTVALYPSPHLNRRTVGDGDGFLFALLDDLDIHGKKRREIEHMKPQAEFVLAHALYAASRGKAAGWVIVETLAQSVPAADFITFARLSQEEWLALWRGAERGEWSMLPNQLYQIRGEWMQAFDGVFKCEPFTEVAVTPKRSDQMQPVILEPETKTELSEDDKLWKLALGELQLQLTGATFETWLARTKIQKVEKGNNSMKFTIECHNSYAVDWLSNRMSKIVSRTLSGLVKREDVDISFVVGGA